jgi:hypothetical protein
MLSLSSIHSAITKNDPMRFQEESESFINVPRLGVRLVELGESSVMNVHRFVDHVRKEVVQ